MLNPLARYPEVQQASGRSMLPITLIGGFLGAGKTTLLNSLLSQGDGRRLAVLVNDFGALNIDAKLVVNVEGGKMELANGCICCDIRDDLVAGIETLLASEPAPEQLVIETSGVSDPMNIVCTFNTSKVRRSVFLENVITVVDALHALDARDAEWNALFERQIRGAYMIVLNRTKLAGAEQTQKVRELISELMPTAAVFETEDGTVPLGVLLGDSRIGQSTFRPEPTMYAGSHPFESMVFKTEKPIRRVDFVKLMRELVEVTYRVKGFINFRNYPLTTLYQKVGNFESYVDGGSWGVTTPMTELVLIGVKKNFDPAKITKALEACCADS